MKKLYIILALLIPLFSSAQVFIWNKVVDTLTDKINNNINISNRIIKKSNNAIYYLENVSIQRNLLSQTKFDSVIISKFTLDGNTIWKKKYPLLNGGKLNDFIITPDNGMLLVGEVDVNNSIIKLNANGDFVFAKNYLNTDSLLTISKIVATNDGNYMLTSYKDYIISTCYFFNVNDVKEQSYITKITPDGNIIWHKFLSESEFRYGMNYYNNNYNNHPTEVSFDFLNDTSFNIIYFNKIKFDTIDMSLNLLHVSRNGNNLDSVVIKNYQIYSNPWFCTSDNANDNFKITSNGYTIFHTEYRDTSQYLIKYYYNKSGILIDSTIRNINSNFFLGGSVRNTNNIYNGYFSFLEDSTLNYYPLIFSNINSNNSQFSYTKCDTDYLINTIQNIELFDNNFTPNSSNFLCTLNDSTLLFIGIVHQNNSQDSLTYLKFYHISLNSNHIEYSIYIDRNNNGILDNLDTSYSKCLIELDNGSSIQTLQPISTTNAIEANYSKYLLAGNYTSKLISYDQTLRYYTVTPLTKTSIFSTNYNGVDSILFQLTPKPNIQDLQVNIIPITNARPGFNTYYKITAKNVGTKTTENISVQFIKDHLQSVDTTYYTQPYAITEDTIIWQIDSLRIFEEQSFYVVCNNAMPPDLNIGDTLHLLAQIFPIENDSFIQDNVATLHQPIVNAVDPNDKIETHGGNISFSDIQHQEYLYYTIRFQNTGSSYASRVVITDTLTNNLDPTTLEMLSFSHTFTYNVIDRKYITWTSPNIYLPDSTTDEAASHGYISFRIKPKANLSHTDVITNRASIIFDYNEAIATNTCTTNIIEERISGIQQNNIKSIKLFPSPTSGNVQLSFDASFNQNLTVKIMNLQGNVIYQQDIKNQLGINAIELQLSEFANGIYFIQLNADNNNLYYGKVLKQ